MANNAAIVLEHLNDRKHAIEKADAVTRQPALHQAFEAIGCSGCSTSRQAINIYDKNGYILKINVFHSKCS